MARYQYQLFAASNDDDNPDGRMYSMMPDPDIQRKISNNAKANYISFILRASGEVRGGRAGTTRRDPYLGYIDLAGNDDFDGEYGHKRAYVQFKTSTLPPEEKIWQDIQ